MVHKLKKFRIRSIIASNLIWFCNWWKNTHLYIWYEKLTYLLILIAVKKYNNYIWKKQWDSKNLREWGVAKQFPTQLYSMSIIFSIPCGGGGGPIWPPFPNYLFWHTMIFGYYQIILRIFPSTLSPFNKLSWTHFDRFPLFALSKIDNFSISFW